VTPRGEGADAGRAPWALTLCWLLPALAIVVTCGWLGLIEPTEARYAEIAREMMARGDWLVPHLNGIPHFHKPPVAYWVAAGGMSALGVNEWGARLGVALAAAFVLWCVARIARRERGASDGPDAAGPDVAGLAPLLLASSFLFFALSRQLASDIFLSAAVAAFYVAYWDRRLRAGMWPFVALAAGFMAKGPVVFVLTVVPVLLAAWWARDSAAARPLARWRGWALFAVLALPWYLLVVFRTPGLLTYLLERQIWERYTTTVQHRGGPFYYFVAVVLVGALPWTWAALAEGWRIARRGWALRRVGAAQPGDPSHPGGPAPTFEDALLVTWVIVPVVFLSFSGSKLPAYVLPIFPALALLAARALAQPTRAVARGTGATLILLAIALEVIAMRYLDRLLPGASATLPPIVLELTAIPLVAAGVWVLLRKPATGAVCALLALFTLLWLARPLDAELGSPREMAKRIARLRQPGEPIVEIAQFNAGVPFYLGETIPMLEVQRDLGFEDPASRARAIVNRAQVARLLETHKHVWVLGPLGPTEELAKELGVEAKVVGHSGRETLTLFKKKRGPTM